MDRFCQFLSELSPHDTVVIGYYIFTFLFCFVAFVCLYMYSKGN